MTRDTQDPKILIIEDEDLQYKAFAHTFIQEGYQVVRARDGEEGISLALQERPDIIFLDILMPKIDGMTALKRLRSEGEWGRKVPVIILTNLIPYEKQRMQDIQQTEPVYYYLKSKIVLQDLVEKVREQLEIPR